jgi:phospholipase C
MKSRVRALLGGFSTVALGAAMIGCGGGGGTPAAGGPGPPVTPTPSAATKIKHVIIVFQENRSPDDLFRGLANADTDPAYGLNSQGQQVTLEPIDLDIGYDLDHSHGGFTTEYDNGKLDGFDLETPTACNRGQCPPPGQRAYRFVPKSQTQEYWQLAQQYVFADRMFQSNQGPSFPAHQYIISGTSMAAPANPGQIILENPYDNNDGPAGGCDSPSDAVVQLADPGSGQLGPLVYPCFDHPVLMDLLDAKGVSWRYYQPQTPPAAGLWTLDAIAHIVHGPDVANISAPNTNILSDIAGGTLPSVSWVMPTAGESDHPEGGAEGPAWVGSIANAVGSSHYWNSTAIVVTWDDWGGWYDHVPPPVRNADELGFRVPMIVVSPYAKRAYVSHVQYEFGSILKFVEETFGLGSLGFTDAGATDLADCFDFAQTPRTFKQIQSRFSRAHFMRERNDTRPLDDE